MWAICIATLSLVCFMLFLSTDEHSVAIEPQYNEHETNELFDIMKQAQNISRQYKNVTNIHSCNKYCISWRYFLVENVVSLDQGSSVPAYLTSNCESVDVSGNSLFLEFRPTSHGYFSGCFIAFSSARAHAPVTLGSPWGFSGIGEFPTLVECRGGPGDGGGWERSEFAFPLSSVHRRDRAERSALLHGHLPAAFPEGVQPLPRVSTLCCFKCSR